MKWPTICAMELLHLTVELGAAYAEEAQPAVVARVALGAEEDERDEQGGAQAVEPYPVLREDVHVYDCDGDEKQDAQHQRQALDDDVLRASVVVGLRSARDDYDAVYRADDADSEEKHVRPAHEVAQLGQDFFQGAHLGTGKCGNMGLSHILWLYATPKPVYNK